MQILISLFTNSHDSAAFFERNRMGWNGIPLSYFFLLCFVI